MLAFQGHIAKSSYTVSTGTSSLEKTHKQRTPKQVTMLTIRKQHLDGWVLADH